MIKLVTSLKESFTGRRIHGKPKSRWVETVLREKNEMWRSQETRAAFLARISDAELIRTRSFPRTTRCSVIDTLSRFRGEFVTGDICATIEFCFHSN